MPYPGGKGAAGVAQRIISLMPPHEIYIEPFLGVGTVMQWKKSAQRNIGLDLDCATLALAHAAVLARHDNESSIWQFVHEDALGYLSRYPFTGSELVYCDPPYLLSTRTRRQYRHELTEQQHIDLLDILVTLPCSVMLSGYWSALYTQRLNDWHVISYKVITRGGTMATEYLWANYAPPLVLHDYRYLGEDFRDRERIKRQQKSWLRKLAALPTLERHALLQSIMEVF